MSDPAKISDLEVVFSHFLNVALALAGIAVLVMLISGGLGFLMAGSDKDGTQRAQRTITYAIGGLVLTLCSWIILNLVGQYLGLPNIGDFSILLK